MKTKIFLNFWMLRWQQDDRALQDMVLNLYDFIQSSPWPEEWLEKMTESMNIPDGTDFGKTLGAVCF